MSCPELSRLAHNTHAFLGGSSGSVCSLTSLEHTNLEQKVGKIPFPVVKKSFYTQSNEVLSEFYYGNLLHATYPKSFDKPVALEHNYVNGLRQTTLYLKKIRGVDGYAFADPDLTSTHILQLMVQMIDQMLLLESLGLAHYDINPGNVMFSPNVLQPSGYDVRLLDFGYCSPTILHKHGETGRGDYKAPELIWEEIALPRHERAFTSEVWAWALTCLEIFFYSEDLESLKGRDWMTDREIWGTSQEETYTQVKHLLLAYWSTQDMETSLESSQFLTKCLHVFSICLHLNPAHRASLFEAKMILLDYNIASDPLPTPKIHTPFPIVFNFLNKAQKYRVRKNKQCAKAHTRFIASSSFVYYEAFINLLEKSNKISNLPIAVVLGSVNLYLAYAAHDYQQRTRETKLEKDAKHQIMKPPTEKQVDVILSIMQRLLLKYPISLLITSLSQEQLEFESEICQKLGSALIYEPLMMKTYLPWHLTSTTQLKNIIKSTLNLASYHKAAKYF